LAALLLDGLRLGDFFDDLNHAGVLRWASGNHRAANVVQIVLHSMNVNYSLFYILITCYRVPNRAARGNTSRTT
jgi:hypothetical protein